MTPQTITTAGNGRPYLGTTAKSLHAPSTENRKERAGLAAGTRLNYELQRTAQTILYRRDAEKQHRTCWCYRTVQGDGVRVKRRTDGKGARLAGVGTCGSVWSCPVCAAKITEARRAELMIGMARARALGYAPWLMTLTFPHERSMPLVELLDTFGKALTRFKNSRTYKGIMARAARLGSIRSLEVTWGEANGWHPHTHDLVYTKGDLVELLDWRLDADDPDSTLRVQWFKTLVKVGLAGNNQRADVLEHGIDIRDGTYAAEYVAKFGREASSEGWGLSGELTKSHAKLGKRGERFTPFQLLQWARTGDDQAKALFRDFAEAFQGKRMLTYSPAKTLKDGTKIPGLKQALSLAEIDDEVLASMETPMPDEEHAGTITVDQYREVIRRGLVGELLDYAATALTDLDTAQSDLDDWLAWVAAQPARYGGAVRQKRHFGPGFMEH